MSRISNTQLFSLMLGGRDGGIIVAGTTATTGKVIHLIECLEADTTFTVLAGVEADGSTARNYIVANGYSGVALPIGHLIGAPLGGKISSFTADKAVRYFRLPTTSTVQND